MKGDLIYELVIPMLNVILSSAVSTCLWKSSPGKPSAMNVKPWQTMSCGWHMHVRFFCIHNIYIYIFFFFFFFWGGALIWYLIFVRPFIMFIYQWSNHLDDFELLHHCCWCSGTRASVTTANQLLGFFLKMGYSNIFQIAMVDSIFFLHESRWIFDLGKWLLQVTSRIW